MGRYFLQHKQSKTPPPPICGSSGSTMGGLGALCSFCLPWHGASRQKQDRLGILILTTLKIYYVVIRSTPTNTLLCLSV